MPDPLLSLKQIVFSYKNQPVLNGLNLDLAPHESIGLIGANGSGKTTLFRCITGLEKVAKGQILFAGREINSAKDFQFLRRHVGFSLQNAEDQLIFPTVSEDVSFGPLNLGLSQQEANVRTKETLELLGIGSLADRFTIELSGGQQKLVALCAVLAMRPKLLLLDEPFNGLDQNGVKRLVKALTELACAKLIVAHDHSLLKKLCPRLLALSGGILTAHG